MSSSSKVDIDILDIDTGRPKQVEQTQSEASGTVYNIVANDIIESNPKQITLQGRQYTLNLGDYSSIKIGPYSVTIDTESLSSDAILDAIKSAQVLIKKLTTNDIQDALESKSSGITDGIKRQFLAKNY